MYSPEYQYTFKSLKIVWMTKLIPIFIEGKKWIQLSQLSADQAQSLKSFLPVNCLKKLLFHGMELSECLDFDTYEYWFKSHQIVGQRHPVLDF